MERRIGHEINQLSRLIGQELRSNSLNLTGVQCFIISQIHVNGGSMNQNDIQKLFCSRRSTITALINGLEKENYIVREKDINDKRINILKLTEKGKEYSLFIKANIDKNESKLQSSLSEEEKDLFFRIIDKLSQSMKGV